MISFTTWLDVGAAMPMQTGLMCSTAARISLMDLRDACLIPAAALNDGVKVRCSYPSSQIEGAAALHPCDNARELPPADRPPASKSRS
jgi:hypothetical protein